MTLSKAKKAAQNAYGNISNAFLDQNSRDLVYKDAYDESQLIVIEYEYDPDFNKISWRVESLPDD